MCILWYFRQAPIFYVCANILGRRQYFMILLDFVAANICLYFHYLFTVKSPYFVTAHNFVTTGINFWKSPFRFLFKISNVCKNIMPMKYFSDLKFYYKETRFIWPFWISKILYFCEEIRFWKVQVIWQNSHIRSQNWRLYKTRNLHVNSWWHTKTISRNFFFSLSGTYGGVTKL